ncbi:Bromodomain containing protein, partial [Aphelenchoides avenae]
TKSQWPLSIQYEFDSDDEQSSAPMTHNEKRKLSLNINKLPAAQLTQVVSIVERRENNMAFNAVEIELDFEVLQPKTLRELETYVNACLAQN